MPRFMIIGTYYTPTTNQMKAIREDKVQRYCKFEIQYGPHQDISNLSILADKT